MTGRLITKNLSKRSRLKKRKQRLCDRINQCKSEKEIKGWERNWKYLVSTTLPDGMYYEMTYDGDKNRWYLDAYKKFDNQCLTVGKIV